MNLEEALLEAKRLLDENSGDPRESWHPKYGWLMIDGKPTEALEQFFADIQQTTDNRQQTRSKK